MSYDIVQEDVPPFTKRIGDYVTQGSNNTIIIMGTDRAKKGPATIDDGLGHTKSTNGGKSSGAIHLITGRKDKSGNPDMERDSAFVYISMNTEVDKNLGLSSVEGDAGKASAVVTKADTVRVVVRKDMKFSFDGGSTYITLSKDKIVLEGKQICLGKGAKKHLVRYEDLEEYVDKHFHVNGAGPTGGPVVKMATFKNKIMTKTTNEIMVT